MPGADEAFGQAWLEAGEVEPATALGEVVGIIAEHLDEGRFQGGAASEPQDDDGRAGLARVGPPSRTPVKVEVTGRERRSICGRALPGSDHIPDTHTA